MFINMDKIMEQLKEEIRELKEKLAVKEKQLRNLESEHINRSCNELSSEEIVRYSRQMIMPEIQIQGQIALKKSKVLIVGIGGLGCPASLYLASAGIGEITLVDYDTVELSNLHRQVLHFQRDLDKSKVESAYDKLQDINNNINIIPLKIHANSTKLSELIKMNKYDAVIDGSDNVATRYLLNDICVMNKIPLVSGSALQMEGQLTVYNYKDGPCYRCLFPIPPPPHTVTNCGDGGVLGPIPGTIGILQALETIKILTCASGILSGHMLLFDGATTTFRKIKLRPRNLKCDVCGDNPSITSLIDYEQFCGSKAHDKVINIDIVNDNEQIDVSNLPNILKENDVIDVRPELEFKMCSLPNTVNYPYTKIQKNSEDFHEFLQGRIQEGNRHFYFLCRRGNDSQRAINYLKNIIKDDLQYFNIMGGLHAYAKQVDSNFPIY